MQRQTGSNHKDIKQQNRLLILKLVAANQPLSRVELAHRTGLTKMTIGNIVSDLMAEQLLEETAAANGADSLPVQGRPPIQLRIHRLSPVICGMLIKRGFCQVITADLSGTILNKTSYEYKGTVEAEDLYRLLLEGFTVLKEQTERRIAAIGIASVGPINSATGMILNPPSFYHIENVPIVLKIKEATSLPVFLVNDADAGAMAEKLYGIGKDYTNFTYLHFMNGIGAGFILENKLYQGDFGQCGEIGHTSISFSGPACSCGNHGCLELYASVENMRIRAKELSYLHKNSSLLAVESPVWCDFIDSANRQDALALIVLDEFCEYVSHAMVNLLNLLNLSLVIVGYHENMQGKVMEEMLSNKIASSALGAKYKPIVFVHSGFNGDAPLIGTIAAVTERIFSGELKLQRDAEVL